MTQRKELLMTGGTTDGWAKGRERITAERGSRNELEGTGIQKRMGKINENGDGMMRKVTRRIVSRKEGRRGTEGGDTRRDGQGKKDG